MNNRMNRSTIAAVNRRSRLSSFVIEFRERRRPLGYQEDQQNPDQPTGIDQRPRMSSAAMTTYVTICALSPDQRMHDVLTVKLPRPAAGSCPSPAGPLTRQTPPG